MRISICSSAARVLILLVVMSGNSLLAQGQTWTGQASVIDGDTIDIGKVRFRLHGIDAPESSQLCQTSQGQSWRCGQRAALALSDRIGRGHVTCRQTDMDRYSRVVAVCTFKGQDLNRWMVRNGWALAYTKYAMDYTTDEKMAAIESSGIWSGTFINPSAWRRGERLGSRSAAPASNVRVASRPNETSPVGCAIKGNVGRKGKRIYHLPGTRWYVKTQINKAAGERWFCSEQDAVSAGWRRAGS